MEVTLISERNYWKNKFENLENTNHETLKELQSVRERLTHLESAYERLMKSWVNLVNERLQSSRMLQEMKAFYDKHQNVFK